MQLQSLAKSASSHPLEDSASLSILYDTARSSIMLAASDKVQVRTGQSLDLGTNAFTANHLLTFTNDVMLLPGHILPPISRNVAT